MIVFALMSILMWQKGNLVVSSVLMGIAINIKMSALLLVPGYLLTVCLDGVNGGIVKTGLVVVLMVLI